MRIKKYAVLLAALIMMLAPKAYADTVARYIIRNDRYDAEAKTYTADVYLNTTEYLSTGTFGIRYDASLALNFELDKKNFTEFQSFPNNGDSYHVFQWYLSKDAPQTTGEIRLGTITVKNVVLNNDGKPSGWYRNTFRQLDWFDTPESKDSKYTANADSVCLNDEIFRRYEDGSSYYQGYDMADEVNPEWVDIGFVFDSGYDLPERTGQTVSGTVQSYNPNNKVTVTLYKKGTDEPLSTVDISDYRTVYPDGRVICGYELTEIDEGEYTLEIEKDVHLTYRTDIKVEGDVEIGNIKLYCGDIHADEKIKLDDRSVLRRYLNKQISGETAVRCDLNGDGKITFHDLDILKTYYNKDYKGVV